MISETVINEFNTSSASMMEVFDIKETAYRLAADAFQEKIEREGGAPAAVLEFVEDLKAAISLVQFLRKNIEEIKEKINNQTLSSSEMAMRCFIMAKTVKKLEAVDEVLDWIMTNSEPESSSTYIMAPSTTTLQ